MLRFAPRRLASSAAMILVSSLFDNATTTSAWSIPSCIKVNVSSCLTRDTETRLLVRRCERSSAISFFPSKILTLLFERVGSSLSVNSADNSPPLISTIVSAFSKGWKASITVSAQSLETKTVISSSASMTVSFRHSSLLLRRYMEIKRIFAWGNNRKASSRVFPVRGAFSMELTVKRVNLSSAKLRTCWAAGKVMSFENCVTRASSGQITLVARKPSSPKILG